MEFLKYFITEDIYLVPDNRTARQEDKKTADPQGINSVESGKADIVTEGAKNMADIIYPLTVITAPLGEEEEKLLGAILNAVNIKISDISILNKEKDQLQSNKVLVFGNAYFDQLPLYKTSEQDEKEFLKADDLAAINNDVEKKRKLWVCMKEMFSV